MVNGNFAGKYFVMAQQTKSTGELTPIQSLADEDYFIVQVNGGGTSLIKKSNLVLTPENVNFYALIKSVKTTNETLLSNSLSAVDTYDDLRRITSATDGKLMYVRKRDEGTDDFNGNGTFQYRSGVGADNDGTVLTLPSDPDDPNPAVPSGGWERINISRVDARWFGYGAGGDISANTIALQSAFDYAAANDIPVYIPSGTNTTYSLSAAADLEITGKGTINFDNTNGSNIHISINNARNVKISGIELSGADVPGTFGINASGSNKLILDGVTISNFDTNVEIAASNNIRISNSIITSGSTVNIKCTNCSGGIITGNKCTTITKQDPTDPSNPAKNTIHSIDVSDYNNSHFRITDNYGHAAVSEAAYEANDIDQLPVKATDPTILTFNNYSLLSGNPLPIFQGGATVGDLDVLTLLGGFPIIANVTINGTDYPFTLPVATTTLKITEGVIREIT